MNTPTLAAPAAPTRSSGLRWAGWALLWIYFVAALFTLLVRLEVASVLAPLLGPWGGHAYGHTSCTMAAALPVASRITLGLLPVAILLAVLGRRRWLLALPLLVWFVAWVSFAWLSAINTLS